MTCLKINLRTMSVNRGPRQITTPVCYHSVFGRPFLKQFALCYRTVFLCLSVCPVLSVTLVYCGQTVSWIKMKLGMDVGLGPGHIVVDGDPASPQKGGTTLPPIFAPCLLWPNGWMGKDATSYGGRPRPRRHSVR